MNQNAMEGLRQDKQMPRRAVFGMVGLAEICLEMNLVNLCDSLA